MNAVLNEVDDYNNEVTWAVFNNLGDTDPKYRTGSYVDYLDSCENPVVSNLKDGRCVTPGVFKKGMTRLKVNMDEYFAIMIDLDDLPRDVTAQSIQDCFPFGISVSTTFGHWEPPTAEHPDGKTNRVRITIKLKHLLAARDYAPARDYLVRTFIPHLDVGKQVDRTCGAGGFYYTLRVPQSRLHLVEQSRQVGTWNHLVVNLHKPIKKPTKKQVGEVIHISEAVKKAFKDVEPNIPDFPEEKIKDGRNNALTSFLGHLNNKGLSEAEWLVKARTFNQERCTPPMDDSEVSRTVVGCFKRYNKPVVTTVSGDLPKILLQGNGVRIIDSANSIFKALGETELFYYYAGKAHKLAENKKGYSLEVLKPEALRSEMEVHTKVMRRVVHRDGLVEKDAVCSMDSSKAVLASDAPKQHLPHVRVLSSCPILTENLEILNKGFYPQDGGILITEGEDVPEVDIGKAVSSIKALLKDYDFLTASDKSRAISSLLTPVMKMGGFIEGVCPIHGIESDESQSGKTTISKIPATSLNILPEIVSQRRGGVGSFDESLGAAIATGKVSILLDNLKDSLNSPMLEAFVTSSENVSVRLPGKGNITVDASHVSLGLTSNHVSLSKDAANRMCMSRIRKPVNKAWTPYPEGDLIEHIRVKQTYYLGCYFAVIKEWVNAGKPRTKTLEHDFRAWSQSLDWIVQNIFKMAPLLSGHRSIQTAVSTPALTWLRQLCLVVEDAGELECELTATNLAQMCEDDSLSYPNGKQYDEVSEAGRYVGMVLGKVFKDIDEIVVDSYTINRKITGVYSEEHRKTIHKKQYRIGRG